MDMLDRGARLNVQFREEPVFHVQLSFELRKWIGCESNRTLFHDESMQIHVFESNSDNSNVSCGVRDAVDITGSASKIPLGSQHVDVIMARDELGKVINQNGVVE